MKKLLLLTSVIGLLISCKKETNLIAGNEPEIHKELYGSWIGQPEDYVIYSKNEFHKGIIDKTDGISQFNIIIEKITAKGIEGKTIMNGNEKSIKGNLSETKDSLIVTLNDPINSKNAGVYSIKIKNNGLNGNWKPNDKNSKTTLIKLYDFKKKQFTYNPKLMLAPTEIIEKEMPYELYVDYLTLEKNSDGAFRDADENIVTKINSSTTKLVENDLKKYKKIDLQILKNTIYARHGLIFKDAVTRQFFNYSKWYIPFTNSIDAKLTPLEKENIAMLEKFEKYATDNYDNFGR